jgi:uncharacterized membrane protein SirB2
MENYEENLDEQFTTNSPLYLKPETFKVCKSIANWTMFFSILGFISIGLLLITGLIMVFFVGLFGSAEFGRWLGAIYLFFVIIYLIPVTYLFKFSKEMSRAIQFKNNEYFNAALLKLKTHFLIVGVVIILIIVSYLLLVIYMSSLGVNSLLNTDF